MKDSKDKIEKLGIQSGTINSNFYMKAYLDITIKLNEVIEKLNAQQDKFIEFVEKQKKWDFATYEETKKLGGWLESQPEERIRCADPNCDEKHGIPSPKKEDLWESEFKEKFSLHKIYEAGHMTSSPDFQNDIIEFIRSLLEEVSKPKKEQCEHGETLPAVTYNGSGNSHGFICTNCNKFTETYRDKKKVIYTSEGDAVGEVGGKE